jgi:hypothetical protein
MKEVSKMKLLYVLLIGALGIALYLSVIGYRDLLRYREIRAM